jgi:hypothetical protein
MQCTSTVHKKKTTSTRSGSCLSELNDRSLVMQSCLVLHHNIQDLSPSRAKKWRITMGANNRRARKSAAPSSNSTCTPPRAKKKRKKKGVEGAVDHLWREPCTIQFGKSRDQYENAITPSSRTDRSMNAGGMHNPTRRRAWLPGIPNYGISKPAFSILFLIQLHVLQPCERGAHTDARLRIAYQHPLCCG